MNNTKKRPNILFLMTDEQRYDCVGYVNYQVKTPCLDALAAESVNFTRGYTSNPSCIPARAALYTGRYPSQCGTPTFITYLPGTETTFMSLLRDGGYHTAVVGKQHFEDTPIDRGYVYEDIVDCHMPKENMTDTPDQNSYIRFLAREGYSSPEGLTREDGRYADRWIGDEKYYVDAYVGDRALEWFREKRPVEKPWFFTVSFPGPHMPYDGLGLAEDALYDEADIELPETCQDDLSKKPSYYMEQLRTGHGNPGRMPVIDMTPDEIRRTRKAYYTTQSLIDRKIGGILEALRESGEYENTLIIYTSDHGDFMGDFGMVGKGQYLSEVLMRVPFLLKPPTAPDVLHAAPADFAGRREEAFVSTTELAATCLTLAGLEIPEDKQQRSLSAFWTEEPQNRPVQDDLYAEARDACMIRTGGWKLVFYQDRSYGELYNLKDDPWEKENLWERAEHQSDLTAVKADLITRMTSRLIGMRTRPLTEWNTDAPAI